MKINLEDIKKAQKTVMSIISPSPLIFNEWLSSKYDCNVYLKLENLLPVGSFKIRGALNKLSTLSEEQRSCGVLAVSAGNHAQGVAWAARRLNIFAKVIMPENAPLTKIKRTKSLGAEVELFGKTFGEAYEYSQKVLKENSYAFIHPFQDPAIIAGQGIIGLELLKDLKKIDYVFSSIGGGGLMSGIGTVFQSLSPETKIMASQAFGTHSMVKSLRTGVMSEVEFQPTIADGIKVKCPSETMFEILKNVISETFIISDSEIGNSILNLLENTSMLVEGAGAINLAALDAHYKKDPKSLKGKNIVLMLCGGNIDARLLERVIEKSLFNKKRRWRFKLLLNDSPGELQNVTQLLCDEGVNILDVSHQREKEELRFDQTIVNVLVELRDESHFDKVKSKLIAKFKLLERK